MAHCRYRFVCIEIIHRIVWADIWFKRFALQTACRLGNVRANFALAQFEGVGCVKTKKELRAIVTLNSLLMIQDN